MKNKFLYINLVDYFVIGFIFLILFILPILFTRVNGEIAWNYVLKIWKDQILLIPLFAINHWLLTPKLLLKKLYISYVIAVTCIITIFTITYYFNDEVLNKKPLRKFEVENKRPEPIPPYANLIMYSLLLAGVDSGLSFSKKWHENEEKRQHLENENTKMQLDILRNQISPHFFMNTMNNIYGLIDLNSQVAKESVMKLSKLMRYILYDNINGKVKLSKEFEFLKSFTDLMRLRSDESLNIQLSIPEEYDDIDIPSMLFISYIENAFKYGVSYQNASLISIEFAIKDRKLIFNCINTKNAEYLKQEQGGLGLRNNEDRLKLLFGNSYKLEVDSTDKLYNVSLIIPLS